MNTNSNSHEPLVDSALIGANLAAEYHLSNCPCCQGEREKTEHALQEFAAFQREEANRSESFWEEQAARIRSARSSMTLRPSLTAVLAPAAVLLVVVGLVLAPQRKPQTHPAAAQAPAISDHDLLVAVERAVDNGTPDALEPVAFVVDEPASSAALPVKKTTKELSSHAN
jgi:hypothetical protein